MDFLMLSLTKDNVPLVTRASTNKEWIIEYNTTLRAALMYCIGYIDANNDASQLSRLDGYVYFHESCKNYIEASGDDNLKQLASLLYLTEQEFQTKRKG